MSLEDLSVSHYLNFTISACRRILAGHNPSPTVDIAMEYELEAARGSAGNAAFASPPWMTAFEQEAARERYQQPVAALRMQDVKLLEEKSLIDDEGVDSPV